MKDLCIPHGDRFDFNTVIFYGRRMPARKSAAANDAEDAVCKLTKVQFLYRHQNKRYYGRALAGGKEKWTSLRTTLLSVARNRMKEHLDAAERQRGVTLAADAVRPLTFAEVTKNYQDRLETADIRPNTQAYREARLNLVRRTSSGIEDAERAPDQVADGGRLAPALQGERTTRTASNNRWLG